ncbi:MAG: hypothetical protein JWM64_415, partial [Frankiales bacterium]|nr:hypothetical protein [Frankiales bacterium]
TGAGRPVLPPGRDTLVRSLLQSLQRTAGNAAAIHLLSGGGPHVQRAPVAQREPASKEGILDGVHITTYADAAGFLESRVGQLEGERAAVLGDGAACPPQLFSVAFEGRQLLTTVRVAGAADIDGATYDQVDSWYGSWGSALDAGEVARTLLAAQKVHDVKVAAMAGKDRALAYADQVADAKAKAFQADDETLLGQIWSWGTALVDSALDATPLIEAATDLEKELVTAARAASASAGPNAARGGGTYKLAEAGKVLPLVTLANHAVNAFQAVQAAADLVSAKKSGAAKAKSDVKAAVAIAGSVEGFIGVATGVGIMINLYLTPMTDACLTALQGLEDVARKVNRELMQNGVYDKVNWDLEPGSPNGRALFMFMLAVRGAGDAGGVPQPVPKQVSDYLAGNQDDLQAGTGTGEQKDEMPTTGAWFWKAADSKKIGSWVFQHRDDLWAVFYGSLRPGGGG